jgi:hypothetical protein
MIIIDGHASAWFRPAMILKSNTVPIVVESNFAPLYMDQWVPWVHYVPVKSDMSDLVEKVKWLKENDEEAFQIAHNGNDLYE